MLRIVGIREDPAYLSCSSTKQRDMNELVTAITNRKPGVTWALDVMCWELWSYFYDRTMLAINNKFWVTLTHAVTGGMSRFIYIDMRYQSSHSNGELRPHSIREVIEVWME